MPTDRFVVSRRFKAPAARVFEAWLSGPQHADFTGSPAELEARVGGAHRAWGGFIWGEVLELSPPGRAVFSWTTQAFPEGAPASRVELTVGEVDGGCEVTIDHSGIPEGQGADYEQGWRERYFDKLEAWLAPS